MHNARVTVCVRVCDELSPSTCQMPIGFFVIIWRMLMISIYCIYMCVCMKIYIVAGSCENHFSLRNRVFLGFFFNFLIVFFTSNPWSWELSVNWNRRSYQILTRPYFSWSVKFRQTSTEPFSKIHFFENPVSSKIWKAIIVLLPYSKYHCMKHSDLNNWDISPSTNARIY